jgi:hypothetical protein
MLNKQAKKNAVKDLEIKLTDRFIGVVRALGYNSDKITKDIKKASKQFSKKLQDDFHDFKNTGENKAAKSKLKADKAAIKAEEKAKKIVIKATKNYSKAVKVIANVQKHVISEFYQPNNLIDIDSHEVVKDEVGGKDKVTGKRRPSLKEAVSPLKDTSDSDLGEGNQVPASRVVRKRKTPSETTIGNTATPLTDENRSTDELNPASE